MNQQASSHPHPGQSPQMGVPTQQANQAQVVYPQVSQAPRHSTPTFYAPTMSQNIRQQTPQPRQPLSMGSSPAQTYQMQPPMYQVQGPHYMAATPTPTQIYVPPGVPMQYNPRMVSQQGQTHYTITAPSQPQQFGMQPSPASYYQQPTQPNNPPIYYSNNVTGQQRPMATPTPQAPKREKKILVISDPDTGKVINEAMIGNKASTPPLAGENTSDTPPAQPPTSNTAIAAQFAAQVAATLNHTTKTPPKSEEVIDQTMADVKPVVKDDHMENESGDNLQSAPTNQTEKAPVEAVQPSPIIKETKPPQAREPSPAVVPQQPERPTIVVTPEPEPSPPRTIKENAPVASRPIEKQTPVSKQKVETVVKEEVAIEPTPVVAEPARVATEPARVATEPARVATEPARVATEPARVVAEPTRTASPAAPTPKPAAPVVKASPEPEFKTPEPVSKVVKQPVEQSQAPAAAQAATRAATSADVNNVDDKPVVQPVQPAKPPAPVEPPAPVPDQVEIKVVEKVPQEPIVQNGKNEDDRTDEAKENDKNAAEDSDAREPIKNKTELKYKYREDQWSPINTEGKKSYDRDFLLNLQFVSDSMSKPNKLPRLPDVILDKPATKGAAKNIGGDVHLRPGGMVDFTPSFFKASGSDNRGRPGGGGGRESMGRRSGQRGGDNKTPRKIINISVQQDIKLHHAESAWKPTHSAPAAEETNVNEELYKKTRGILNKLTPQKFKTLVAQIMELEIDTETKLRNVIDLIFDKALDEPGFSVAYANMCKCLQPLKVPAENPTKEGEKATFRKLLITRCQREFEKEKENANSEEREKKIQEIKSIEDEPKRKLALEEFDYAELKAKRRTLGNIRFIGELFKLKMLVEPIMHDCIVKLLKSNDQESYECLCRLLSTIGKDIDHEEAKPMIDQYITQMQKIVDQKKTCSRVRFMLQDVMELRRNMWVPRREDNNPRTIDQIHKEVEREDAERAMLLQQFNHQQKQGGGQGNRNMRGGRGSSQGQTPQKQADDGWNTVGAKTSRAPLDPSKLRLTKQKVDDNIQLGPGGGMSRFSGWGRGSSGGGNAAKQQEPERPTTPANRFSALSGGAGGPPAGVQPNESEQRGRPSMGRGGQTPGRGSDQRSKTPQNTPRGGKRPSEDREAALAAVRNMGVPPNQVNTGDRVSSRDNSRNRDVIPPAADTSKQMTVEEMEKKTKSILDEFLHIQDKKEAILCIEELRSPQTISTFVYTALNHVLERSQQARRQTGMLIHDVVKSGAVSVDSYVKGLQEILEFADDMEIDIPKIWNYLAELIGPMIQDSSVPLLFLKDAFQPLLRCNKAGKLAAAVLHDASTRLGHHTVAELWKASGLQWSDFLAPGHSRTEFIKQNSLEFTVDSDTPLSPTVRQPLAIVKQELRRLIEKNISNEQIFDWISSSVGEPQCREPQFIRALMRAVCNSAIKGSLPNISYELKEIKDRQLLLQRYLDHQPTLELQALYELQALVHELEHPPGLLRNIFDTLYDEDIISEDAFNQWEASEDPAEQEGKGVARKSVVQFFTWLREADEEAES
ncbi:unnamed protein product [Owenia fusiformis]|nr:unnamed protein product [Owenia fusiformis]